MTTIKTRPLTPSAFAPFGDVLQLRDTPDKIINQGLCGRHHDLAQMNMTNGRAAISLFNAQPRQFPFTLELMERHPDGSQAFIPMHQNPYLVIVAHDKDNAPDTPKAFIASGVGVNYHRNVWHAVLCPLSDPGLFAVVDRIGDGANLEEHWFDIPWVLETY